MTPESIKMSNLILDAEILCNDKGHNMDWQRFSNDIATSKCRICGSMADIDLFFPAELIVWGNALHNNCTKKGR